MTHHLKRPIRPKRIPRFQALAQCSFPSIVTSRYPSEIAWKKQSLNYSPLGESNQTVFEHLARAGLRPIGICSHFYFTPDHAVAMIEGSKKLIHRVSERRWELYDLAADPDEKKNLADDSANRETLHELRRRLVDFEEKWR